MRREFLPRTEPYRQSKWYANYQSYDSGPDRNWLILTNTRLSCSDSSVIYENSDKYKAIKCCAPPKKQWQLARDMAVDTC